MNNEITSIERIVMRRVRLIRLLVLVISTAMLAVLAFTAALWGIGREVWVAHVFENLPPAGDLSAFMNFWLSAFLKTTLLVQVLTLLTLVSLAFLARETARTLFDRA